MKLLVESCFRCSVLLLKFNFAFILCLQVVKFLLLNEANYGSEISCGNHMNSTFHPTTRSVLSSLARSLSTFHSYDVNRMEATRTDLVTIYNSNSLNAKNYDLANLILNEPFIQISSFVNFTEIFQFTNLRNMIKLILVLNKNLTLVLMNIIILCFLMMNTRKRSKSKLVMAWNLTINILLLFFVLILNTIFMLIVNKYYKNSSTFKNLNKTLSEFFARHWKDKTKNQVDLKNFYLVDSRFRMSKTASYNGQDLTGPVDMPLLDAANQISPLTYLKLNIVVMLVSTVLLLVYSFFASYELDLQKEVDKKEENERTCAGDDIERNGEKIFIFFASVLFFNF